MVVKGSDEVEPEGETSPAVAIGFFENAKDLELANDVLGEDTDFGQAAVVGFLLLVKRFATPALMGRGAVGVKLSDALEAAVGI